MRLFTAVFCLFSAFSLYSAVVFTDDFASDPGNWNPIFGSQYSVAGGKLTMTNADTLGMQWVITSSFTVAHFSLTVSTEMSAMGENGRAGISFRTQDNADCYQFFVYPDGAYMVSKVENSTAVNFFNNRLQGNSFINAGANLLKAVVKDDTLSFLCNGQLLCRITDTAISGAGRVGLVAGGMATVAFDDLVIDDQAAWDQGLSVFSDDFSTAALAGWKNYAGLGDFAVNSDKLHMTTPVDGNFAMLVSDGSYGSNDTISAVTTRISGTGSYLYGLVFHYSFVQTGPSSTSAQGYIFCIVNGTRFTVLKAAPGGVTMIDSARVSLSIQPATNTLKVINHPGGVMDLYINNSLVRSLTDAEFATGGVGVMGNGGCVVDFDDFRVAGQATLPMVEQDRAPLAGQAMLTANPNPFTPSVRISLVNPSKGAMTLSIYDAAGRLIRSERFKAGAAAVDYLWEAADMPSGIYYARLTAGSRVSCVRLARVR